MQFTKVYNDNYCVKHNNNENCNAFHLDVNLSKISVLTLKLNLSS